MADETVRVKVVGDSGSYVSEVNKAAAATTRLDKSAQAVSKQMVSMAKGFAIGAATTVAVGQLQDAVNMAVNLQDSVGKVGVIFGKAADDVEAFADDTNRSFGLTKAGALDAMATFGIFGKAAGLAGGDLTKFAEDLTKRAVDLKSMWGGSVQDAVTAIGAGLRGESDPLEKYGVLLNDAALKARALKMDLIDSTKEGLTPQVRAMAAAAEIMDQSALASGNFKEHEDEAANSIQNFNDQMGRLKEAFGAGLLPALTEGAQALTVLAGALGKASSAAEGATDGIFKLGTLTWWQNIPGWIFGTDEAAAATEDLGSAASGAAGGVDALGGAATGTAGAVGGMTTQVDSAIVSMNKLGDAQSAALRSQIGMAGIGVDIRNASRQPGTTGGGGRGARESEAESKARQKVISKIREQDQAEVDAEVKRARRRAQRKAEAAADRGAEAAVRAGGAAFIEADKKAKRGEDLTDEDKAALKGTAVGEATGTISKAAQKKLDKEIEGIRARHKKALDTQLKGLEAAHGAAKGAAQAVDTYSTSLDINTEAGRRNLTQLIAGRDAVKEAGQVAYDVAIQQGKSVEKAEGIRAKAMETAREDLLDTYESAGFARKEVDKFLTSLGLIPKTITTNIKVKVDTSELDAAVRNFGPGKDKNGVQKVWNSNLGAWVSGGGAGPASTTKPSTGTRGRVGKAGGGEIYGPGGPRSDSVPIWASAGEYMVNASQYAANRDLVRAINAGSGPVSGGGMSIGQVTVNETSGSRVRASVIDALAETAYRTGAVR